MISSEIRSWQERVEAHPSFSEVVAVDNQTIAILEVALQLATIVELLAEGGQLKPINVYTKED